MNVKNTSNANIRMEITPVTTLRRTRRSDGINVVGERGDKLTFTADMVQHGHISYTVYKIAS